ncbi:hypothetical protein ACTXG6_39475 [Pseudonocardia sp. Cha107L01]|uniref:hypothetical protein n=1 Tax=Pseudonocardia sp. Cha107L01 TaxID=3457576 RepID=UPI00403E8D56
MSGPFLGSEAVAGGLVSRDQLHRFAPAALLARRAATPGARGCRRLQRVVQLADPRAESPRETRLRLGLVLAGLPPPTVQHRVLDEYGFELDDLVGMPQAVHRVRRLLELRARFVALTSSGTSVGFDHGWDPADVPLGTRVLRIPTQSCARCAVRRCG